LLSIKYIWGLVENVIWRGRGWQKTSVYRHMGVGDLKLLKKPSYDIKRSLTAQTQCINTLLTRVKSHVTNDVDRKTGIQHI